MGFLLLPLPHLPVDEQVFHVRFSIIQAMENHFLDLEYCNL